MPDYDLERSEVFCASLNECTLNTFPCPFFRGNYKMPIAYISVKPSSAWIRYIDNILRFNQMVQAFRDVFHLD
jgi:hypothetical protein